jgi:hypothetical protein
MTTTPNKTALSDAATPAYQSGLSRRDSLKMLAALAASTLLPGLTGCEPAPSTATATTVPAKDSAVLPEHWPDLKLSPITAPGYGKDPNQILPPESPWPLTLTPAQLTLVALLADLLIPREGETPSASEVEVPAVINEWVSAPYPRQQQDRAQILPALAWIDEEAKLRFNQVFASLKPAERTAILDDIAYLTTDTPARFIRIAKAFALFRGLVVAAFFASPAGSKDIGYLGNTAIGGDYPGPTPAAKAHLDKVLADLGLTEYAWQGV